MGSQQGFYFIFTFPSLICDEVIYGKIKSTISGHPFSIDILVFLKVTFQQNYTTEKKNDLMGLKCIYRDEFLVEIELDGSMLSS